MPTGWAPPTRAMVAEGASVMIGDILADEGHALVDELGDRAAFVGLDVTDPDQWAAAVRATADRLGAVTVLVNNAGIQEGGLIGSYPLESWHRALDINLTGTFLGCRAVADPMIAAGVGGAIVNTSSIQGRLGAIGVHAYAATKFAVRGLTKSVAVELAPHRIRVNAILPGQIRTDMTRGIPEDLLQTPLGRAAEPAEVSALVVFLASDESSFCTGGDYAVDGGLTATTPFNMP